MILQKDPKNWSVSSLSKQNDKKMTQLSGLKYNPAQESTGWYLQWSNCVSICNWAANASALIIWIIRQLWGLDGMGLISNYLEDTSLSDKPFYYLNVIRRDIIFASSLFSSSRWSGPSPNIPFISYSEHLVWFL